LRERALPDLASAWQVLCRELEREDRLDDAVVCANTLAGRADATDEMRLAPLRVGLRQYAVALRQAAPIARENPSADTQDAGPATINIDEARSALRALVAPWQPPAAPRA